MLLGVHCCNFVFIFCVQKSSNDIVLYSRGYAGMDGLPKQFRIIVCVCSREMRMKYIILQLTDVPHLMYMYMVTSP